MQRTLPVLILCYAICALNCVAQEIEWQKCFGGSYYESASEIVQTYDGNFVIAGSTESNDGDVSGLHGIGMWDYWIIKVSISGNLQWQKCFGGSQDDLAYSIIQTHDNGFVVIGGTESTDGDVTGYHGGNPYRDAWVVKLDSVGNIEWQKCLGGTYDDVLSSVIETTQNELILAGFTESNDGDVVGNHGGNDAWVVKLDSNGYLIWQKCFGGSNHDLGISMTTTGNGNYKIIGCTQSNDGDVSGMHGVTDYWLLEMDSSGNLLWQKCYGGTSPEQASSIIHTSDNGYLFGGWTTSNNGDVSGFINDPDVWLVKVDSIGNIQWEKCLGGDSYISKISLIQDSTKGYLIATYSSQDTILNNFHGGADDWMIYLDSLGNILGQKCFGGTHNDFPGSLIKINENKFILVSSSSSNNGDVINNNNIYPSSNIWMMGITTDFNQISGKLFIDVNNNLLQEAGEPAISNNTVTEINSSRFNLSGQNGNYNVAVLDSGNFTVHPAPINYYNPVPSTHTAYFSSINQTDSLNDFAFQPTGVFNDLCVNITPMGRFRAGFNASYMINYENLGTTTLSPTVIFFPDNDVTFVSANPVANSVTVDSVVWNFGPLAPFQTGSILVTVNVNVGTPIGTFINCNVRIEPIAGDANAVCNYAEWGVYTVGSIDPNAILVDEDTVFTMQLSNPPYLEYIIYFQNTGNDTAFNARVLNNLPPELDVASFEFVASSHPMNITYGAYARLMTFTFDNILLPDSNVNEPESHGFVRYRIKPNTTLVAGDSIRNTAFIYFDFNAPVQTNTAVTEIVSPTGMSELNVQSLKFKVYPNPARDAVTIETSGLEYGLSREFGMKLFDLYGREVFFKQYQTISNQHQTTINVSGFSNGIYFLEINSGERAYRAKFVKQ
ncbi:MAG: T9SS type A sorting domain-containing protein [Bacteroidia bacterium]